jgi:hypothetical protein
LTCADGAGSAAHADLASQLACRTYCEVAEKLFREGEGEVLFTETGQIAAFAEVRAALLARAEGLEVPIRELACTLLVAVVGERRASFVQLGDGAIVTLKGEAYTCVFWPDGGEYANQTNFLSEEHFAEHLLFAVSDALVDEIALLTDGLQRLALNFEARDAFSPFFRGLFGPLRAADEPDELYVDFLGFLRSEKVNSRTDDDKTLVLATRRGETDET